MYTNDKMYLFSASELLKVHICSKCLNTTFQQNF